MITKLLKNIFVPFLAKIQQLEYQLGLIADYPIEVGQDGIWTYRKMASGIAECWGAYTNSNVNAQSAWGAVYTGTYGGQIDYPTNLFIATPDVCEITPYASSTNFWLTTASEGGLHSATKTPAMQITRPSAGTNIPVTIMYYAKGLWKTFEQVGGVILNLFHALSERGCLA